jgi:hypothetical protein
MTVATTAPTSGPILALDLGKFKAVACCGVPKTSSAGRINTTRAGCDVRERAYQPVEQPVF